MSDSDNPQTGGVSVNSEGDTRIGGDVVGRDKYESHIHYEQDPNQGWEQLQASGCLAKSLMIVGAVLLVAGLLGFFGAIVLSSTAHTFDQSSAVGPYAAGGVGAAFIGILLLVFGGIAARYDAFRHRSNTRHR
jgi:ABC-type Na+ efflux pump permease subunit